MFNMESRHLLNLSVQNALDCISKNFNLKNFTGGACARNSLEKWVLRCPYVYYISRTPLSQNANSAPGSTVLQYEQSIKVEKCKSYRRDSKSNSQQTGRGAYVDGC